MPPLPPGTTQLAGPPSVPPAPPGHLPAPGPPSVPPAPPGHLPAPAVPPAPPGLPAPAPGLQPQLNLAYSSFYSSPSGICSLPVAANSGVSLPTHSFSHSVANTGGKTLPVSRMREMYGHEFAPTVAKAYSELPSSTLPVGASLYHPLGSLPPYVTDSSVPLADWHDPILSPPSTRLELLRSNPNIGFILLAGRHWDATSCTFGAPILRILAAPSLPPLLQAADVSGIHIPSLWSTRPPFIGAVTHYT